MNNLRISSAINTIAAAALLAGCGGSQQPIGAPGETAQSSATLTMLGQARSAQSKVLLYVSQVNLGSVLMFTYPAGKLLRTLTGFNTPAGLCTDKKGDVFVVDLGAQDIVEYAHGATKPRATLDDSGNDPYGCYIDPTTGNLAVAGGGVHVGANIAVFAGATGTPADYQVPGLSTLPWCTYDDHGNLFAEGYLTGVQHPNGALVELPAGGTQLTTLSLSTTIGAGGAIQWDGKYLAVGSPRGDGQGFHGPATIYQFQLSGSSATVVNTIKLSTGKGDKNAGGVEFWIGDGYIITPKSHSRGVGRWRYPAGGDVLTSFSTDGTSYGVTLSTAAK